MSISTYIKNLGLCKKSAGHKNFYYHFLEFNVILIIVGDNMIQINYDGLWKILIDHNMKKKDLHNELNIGTGTIAKMSKGEPVSMEVLAKICYAFKCNIEDIVRFVYE